MQMIEASAKENADEAKLWLDEVKKSEARLKKYFDRCDDITRRYRDERDDVPTSSTAFRYTSKYRFNILWSNVQTMLPMLYSRMPRPVIERRFKDDDQVGRVASEMLEKATTTMIDLNGFDAVMKNTTFEFCLYGQGTSWVRYVPTIEDNPAIGPDGQPMPQQVIKFEQAVADFVTYKDFFYSDSRTWEEVSWVARRVYMTRKDLVDRFGKIGETVKLDHKQGTGDSKLDAESRYNKATVYEIWCKPENMVYWIAKDNPDEVLDQREPPLKFDGFFPCPRPAFGTFTTNKIEPVPDFIQYQDQAIELDDVTCRLSNIVRSIKVTGLYDGAFTAFSELLTEGTDNQLFPVNNNWNDFAKQGGLQGALAMLPIDSSIQALTTLYQSREATKQTIYEITGISDIIRGSSNPNETATAQQIKGKFGSMRLQDKQAEVQRFARDNIRLIAEVIAETFQPETLMKMSGTNLPTREEVQMQYQQQMQQFQMQMQQYQQVAMQAQQSGQQPPPPPQQPEPPDVVTIDDVMELLRDDPMRNFRIDIETDSTIAIDYEEEKNSRIEFLSNIGPFLQQMIPVVQQVPQLSGVMGDILMFAVRGFKAGRSLEVSFEDALKELKQQQAQPQEPQPDPEIEMKKKQIEGQLQLQKQKQDGELQLKQQQVQGDLAIKQEQTRGNLRLDRREMTLSDALAGEMID